MKRTLPARVNEANKEAVHRILTAQPVLVGLRSAKTLIPGMKENMFLHSGPPIEWRQMCGPTRGAAVGAMIYEHRAGSEEEALQRLNDGEIEFSPTQHHHSVSPMAGIISPSMPVYIVKNKTFGNEAYCTINEGVGQVKTLRFGAKDKEVIDRLHWIEEKLAPALDSACQRFGEIDLKSITAEALRRGDECHNRNKSATGIFFKTITPRLIRSDLDRESIASILDFVGSNDHFFLNLSMAACKATMEPAHGIEYSTVVTAMTTNGVDFGVRVSGLGDEWFTAPAPSQAKGRLFEGFSKKDANPILGDSYISEPAGIGAFAMAASPAISEFVGSSPSFGVQVTKKMYKITLAKHSDYKIPYLDYQGTPTGICLSKIVNTGIVPILNTGLAHRKPGVGQVGAGIAKPPMACFKGAKKRFLEKYGIRL